MTEQQTCARCGAINAPFGFRGTAGSYWLCGDCWLMTPTGQVQINQQTKRLHEQPEDDTSEDA